MTNRLKPIEAATQFVLKHFPECGGALLAGSASRQETTKTSDLDIIIFDDQYHSSFRRSNVDDGWPIEVFVHSFTSYQDIFKSDYKRARPSMQRMVADGLILKDDGRIADIKAEAKQILKDGPQPWSQKTIDAKRYFITDTLEDLIGADNRHEELFIVNALAELLQEFILRTNQRWVGGSKWIIRELNRYDPHLTDKFVQALDTFYQKNDKEPIIHFTDEILNSFGGRFFDGFSIGDQNVVDK